MKINRKVFFDAVRASMHRGSMTDEQVASYEAILDAAESRGVSDPRHLAYILATTRGEVGSAMQPVREIGMGRGRKYGNADPKTGHVYYGRGFVQLTWDFNYLSMGKRLGLDLYRNPDLALDRKVAAQILVIGMVEGIFTKRKLSDFLNATTMDYEGARRIINGTDRASEFASFARTYEQAIRTSLITGGTGEVKEASGTVTITKPPASTPLPPTPPPAPPPAPEAKPRVSAAQWIIGIIAAAIAAIFTWVFAGGQP